MRKKKDQIDDQINWNNSKIKKHTIRLSLIIKDKNRSNRRKKEKYDHLPNCYEELENLLE